MPAARRYHTRELDEALGTVKEKYLRLMRNASIVAALFTFDTFSDEELDQYVRFWESPAGAWWVRVLDRGFARAAGRAGRDLFVEITSREGTREEKCYDARPMRPAILALLAAGALAAQPYDLLIRNGRVADGTGNPTFRADIAIRGGRVAAMGKLAAAQAHRVIDAQAGSSRPASSTSTTTPTTRSWSMATPKA
ncbi:MAG: hypothetical protein IPM24_13985 [Bryobacterales bacterium]|nr:hypothetical protein [Bryobacterales bacterium]